MDIKYVFISLALCGLFLFAMVNWIYRTEIDNRIGDNIQNDTVMKTMIVSYNNTLSSIQGSSNTQSIGFENETINPNPTSGNIFFSSIFESYKTLKGISLSVFNIATGVIFIKIFGGSGSEIGVIFLAVITGIVIFTMILLAWKLLRTGE